MIFDLFANEKVSFIDDDYKVFEKEIIDKYDIEYLKEEMKKFIKNIKEVQYKYIGICSLKVTSNYELKVDCSYPNSDMTLKTVIKSIETEEELLTTYNTMKSIFDNSFSYVEKIIFIDFYIMNRSREISKEKLRIGNERYSLIKNSCLVKFGLGFNWKNIRKTK
ncbi:MAG: hypothetical protein HFE81_04045 [Bacilli bacterium]|nr:hypothetical protein [Bacilli bacterium]